MPRKTTSTLAYFGYILALLGGIVLILFGLLDLLGAASRLFSAVSLLWILSSTVSAILRIVIGGICIIGSKFVSKLIWAIILLILGVVAGTLGGSLVAIGAILGLVSILLKSAPR
jgi:hypothetical protein